MHVDCESGVCLCGVGVSVDVQGSKARAGALVVVRIVGVKGNRVKVEVVLDDI